MKINNLFFTFTDEFAFGSKWKFLIKPGIYYNRFIFSSVSGHKTTKSIFTQYKSDTINIKADEELTKDGFGVRAGIGLEIPLYKNLAITVDNNYSVQLGTGSDLWITSIGIFNATFEIGVRYRFNKSSENSKINNK